MQIPAHVQEDRVFEFDIYGDASLTDELHESYESLHARAPDVFYTPCNEGHWMFTRYEDILEVVKDPEHFSVREMQIPRVPEPPVFIPLSLDPPENVPYRAALMPFFGPRSLANREARIRQMAIEVIESVADKGECEFVHEVSSKFPVSVFMDIMGLPQDRLREFRTIADAYFEAREQEEFTALSAQIIGIMTEIIELRRKEPGDDLISQMVNFKIQDRPISLEEMQSMCFILFLGGMDTVTNNMSFTYRHLAQDPELQARLVKEPKMIPKFVEEGLRCFGVVNTPRIVTKDCDKFGVHFKKDDMVLCMLPLGSRDDRQHEDPNKFDIDRKRFDHATFSSGVHVCMGHSLARMEMRTFAEEWFKRIPEVRLKPGGKISRRLGTVMSLETLELEWG